MAQANKTGECMLCMGIMRRHRANHLYYFDLI
jgi:hypothetical protein